MSAPPGTYKKEALALLALALLPAAAAGEPAPPLTVDFKRAPVGSWAEYVVKVGQPGDKPGQNDKAGKGDKAGVLTMKTRWAFLARDRDSNTVELSMEGSAAATPAIGGKIVTRMVLLPDPIGAGRPFRQIVVQLGDREPLEVPLDMPGLPQQKFQNPDPKKLVDRPTITVGAGTFATGHYRDELPDSVVDSWLSDRAPPLGVVKIVSTPRPGAVGPGGKPMPPVTMELLANGKDAHPTITRPVRRFDPGADK
jgi:hypothetical protein